MFSSEDQHLDGLCAAATKATVEGKGQMRKEGRSGGDRSPPAWSLLQSRAAPHAAGQHAYVPALRLRWRPLGWGARRLGPQAAAG